MKKRIIPAVILLALTVVACGTIWKCCRAEQTEPASESDRIVLTLAYGKERMCPTDLIDWFNESQDVYELQGVCYRPDDRSLVSAQAQLLKELEAGTAPDIIASELLSSEDLSWQDYAEDLHPWLDADPELSWESMVSSFLDAYAPDEVLYETIHGFSIDTVVVSAAAVDKDADWTYAQLQAIADAMEQPAQLCYTEESANNVFFWFLTLSATQYVDLETGQSNFDQDSFRALLRLCSGLEPDGSSDIVVSPDGVLRFTTVSSFSDVAIYEAMFGGPVLLLGCPDTEDNGSRFSASFTDTFVMNAASENKDGAWEFLRYLFTAEYQLGQSEFATNAAALEQQIEAAQSVTGPTLYSGTGLTLDWTPATDEQIQQVLTLIQETERMSDDIIPNAAYSRALAAYLSGEATEEETIAAFDSADIEGLQ